MGKLQTNLEPNIPDSGELEPMILVPLIDKIDESSLMACLCGADNGLGSGGACECGRLNGGGN
jgi:hypothetical protein